MNIQESNHDEQQSEETPNYTMRLEKNETYQDLPNTKYIYKKKTMFHMFKETKTGKLEYSKG